MPQLRILILTDHRNHSQENSLYALAPTMAAHPECGQLDLATRHSKENEAFFLGIPDSKLYAREVTADFHFRDADLQVPGESRLVNPADYDGIWLRLPPPISPVFLNALEQRFPDQRIINAPAGIQLVGSKEFLLNFPGLCPAMQACTSFAELEKIRDQWPAFVLKPYRDYGGNGLVRIEGDKVWEGRQQTDFADYAERNKDQPYHHLAVEFLTNVDQGDKRIVVVNGKILGASLRLPAKGSWLCNVAAGGHSTPAEVDEDERAIVRAIDPTLRKHGIVMYGLDTLVGNQGRRVLSEINATSIGGIPQIERMSGKPVVSMAVDGIIQAFKAIISTPK